MRGWAARADRALLWRLRDHAPLLALLTLAVQLLVYYGGWLGTWGNVDGLRWLGEFDEATSTALGLVLACGALFVATGVSRRERRYGHDGWWWGFGVFILGPLGLILWLCHHHVVHRTAQAKPRTSAGAANHSGPG